MNRELALASAELGEIIDAAAFAPARWQTFTEQVAALIPGTKIALQVVDNRSGMPLSSVSSGWSERSLAAYREHYWAINPWQTAWQALNLSSVEGSAPYYSHDDLRKTEFFADLLRPEQEVDGATGLKFAAHRDRYALLAIHSDIRHAERVEGTARALLQGLVPRMRCALEANRTMAATAQPAATQALMDGLLDAALLVDETCRLQAANPAARALLGAETLIGVGANDVVRFRHPATNRAFTSLVRQTCQLTGLSHDIARLDDLLVDLPAGRHAVTALPVAPSQATLASLGPLALYAGQPSALIVLRPQAYRAADDPRAALRQALGLTQAEARLAVELMNGGSLQAIADRLALSRETVRSQLKSAFSKTGVHNQRDLVALVMRATRNH